MSDPYQSEGVGLVMAFFFFCLYMVPGLIAAARKHPSKWAVAIANLLFGWTLIGWFICLIWSFTGSAPVVITVTSQQPPTPNMTPEQMRAYLRLINEEQPIGENVRPIRDLRG